MFWPTLLNCKAQKQHSFFWKYIWTYLEKKFFLDFWYSLWFWNHTILHKHSNQNWLVLLKPNLLHMFWCWVQIQLSSLNLYISLGFRLFFRWNSTFVFLRNCDGSFSLFSDINRPNRWIEKRHVRLIHDKKDHLLFVLVGSYLLLVEHLSPCSVSSL